MKIEKLTDNKIRVIIKLDDLEKNDTDINSFLTKAITSQGLFFAILKKAEEEVNFYTDGCKLLIEAFLSSDDVLVFMITKFSPLDSNLDNSKKKKLIIRRKNLGKQNRAIVYAFESFDCFCDFCSAINRTTDFDSKKLAKKIVLYLYNDTYFLVLNEINRNYEKFFVFTSIISEFARLYPFSNNFSSKLLEHGAVIIKKDAINVGIMYFDN